MGIVVASINLKLFIIFIIEFQINLLYPNPIKNSLINYFRRTKTQIEIMFLSRLRYPLANPEMAGMEEYLPII